MASPTKMVSKILAFSSTRLSSALRHVTSGSVSSLTPTTSTAPITSIFKYHWGGIKILPWSLAQSPSWSVLALCMWLDIWRLRGFKKEKPFKLHMDPFIYFYTAWPLCPSQAACTMDITPYDMSRCYVRFFMLHIFLPHACAAQPSIKIEFSSQPLILVDPTTLRDVRFWSPPW